MKKLISICLTICMLLSMVSITGVFAATPSFAGSYSSADAAYKNGYVSTVDNIKAAIRNGDAAEAGVDYQASSSAPWGEKGMFTMVHGDWAYINVNMPYTGVYVMQLRTEWLSGTPAVFQVETEDGYAAEWRITDTGWSSGCLQDQLIYLHEGDNTVKLSLVGTNNGTISAIDFGRLDLGGAKKSEDYLPLVKLADDLAEPTPEPTPTPKVYFPEGWDGVVENHPDYNADADALYIDAFMPNMSSDEGTELFGTDWGTEGSSSIPNKGQANAIYLAPGASVTYTVTVTNEGVYGAQVKMGTAEGPATLQMTNNVNGTEYISQHTFPNRGTWVTTWSNGSTIKADDLIYLQAGANDITITNIGSYGCTYENNDFGIISDSMSLIGYVGTPDNPEGTNPEGWDGMVDEFAGFTGYEGSITALNYNEYIMPIPYTENGIDLDGFWVNYTVTAPAAGMYLVYADVANGETLTLTTEALDYVTFDFSDFTPAYIYLNEGDNVIKATGDVEFVDAYFYQLNNSDAYLDQNNNVNDAPEEPIDLIPRVYTDRTNNDGFYQYGAYEAVVQYAGSSMTYDVNCAFPGIYRVQLKVGGTTGSTYPVIFVDSDGEDGYRATIATSYADDWGAWRATDAEGNYQYVYLKEGVNKVSVTAGGTHHVLWGVEFKLLNDEEKETITMDDLTRTPPKDIVIAPHADKLADGVSRYDYYMIPGRVANDAPMTGDSFGVQLVAGEWVRYEVTVKTAGYYKVFTTAAAYDADATINLETKTNIATVKHTMSPDNYRTFEGDYLYLEEGVNSIWIQNTGDGWVYLQKITLEYQADATGISPRVFVQAHNYIGAPEVQEIEKYTVRNNYYGINVSDTNDTAVNTETKTYNVTIPADDYYGLLMTATMPLVGNVTVTLNNGTDDIVLFNDVAPYFGNENEANTLTLTADKVFLTAGDYTMTFSFTEHTDAQGESMLTTHIHGFEFTTLTRQDLLLAAMQSAEDTADIADALEEYADVLADDIGADPETDFIYPEYSYAALLNCAMLETGAYETYEDVKTAYDFAKNIISAADDGTGSLVYTVQVGDWNEAGTTVLVAVYAGDQLYMMGEGYLEYEEATGSYLPVEATLYDYVPEDGDVIKVFVWDSFDGLKPVF